MFKTTIFKKSFSSGNSAVGRHNKLNVNPFGDERDWWMGMKVNNFYEYNGLDDTDFDFDVHFNYIIFAFRNDRLIEWIKDGCM